MHGLYAFKMSSIEPRPQATPSLTLKKNQKSLGTCLILVALLDLLSAKINSKVLQRLSC